MKALFVFLLVVVLALVAWDLGDGGAEPAVSGHWPAATAPVPSLTDDPYQDSADLPLLDYNGYRLRALAEYALTARVLGREEYRRGREADLSPLDLALGWGPMADESVLASITITQSNRFYFWKTPAYPIPRADIEEHSANVHLIPADTAVARALDAVGEGQVVGLRGYLVEARAGDGWTWRSSLRRSDTGRGACELFYVQAVLP